MDDPRDPDDANSAINHSGFKGFILGIPLTIPALALAAVSAGAGHGDYVFARALFPIPMLMTIVTGSLVPEPLAFALVQFSLYGYACARAMSSRTWAQITMIIGATHLCGVVLCFSGLLPNYS